MKRAVSGILFLLMSVGLFAGGYGGDGYSPTYFATVSAGTLNVTGLLKLADGTAAAPSLTFTNDTNTGIYNPTTYDNLMFTVGGTLRLTLNTTGLTSTVATTAPNFISNVAEGTAPYACTSTTKNTNLNADLLDDLSSAAFGRLAVANTWTAAQMIDGSADVTQFTIQGYAGQTGADYALLIEDSAGNDLFAINAVGNIATFSGSLSCPTNYGLLFGNNTFTGTSAKFGYQLKQTSTQTASFFKNFYVSPTYNQATGTAAADDIYLDRAETAIGSGEHNLMSLGVGGSPKYTVSNGGLVANRVKAITIADSADGNPATYTITPEYQSVAAGAISSYIELTCSDADGCNVTMGETEAVIGITLNIINVGANVCNFADTGGVSELAGAFAMGQYDSLSLRYATGTWVETGRSNN